jgi:tRNA dimethylallyltransferase
LTTPLAPLVAVVGPTGSGKSDLGLYLARKLNGEVVGCDSVQVYVGADIGSAKLRPDQQEGILHHLIDIAAPTEKITAGDYARRARAAIAKIAGRGKLPIVVGGTGLYLKALLEGLSPAPPRNEKFRARLRAAAASRPNVLLRYLRRFDRDSALRIHPNDRQKLTRAVELCHVSKRPASAVQSTSRDALEGFRILQLGLNPERTLLYDKLNSRTAWMFSNGILDETRSLRKLGRDAEILRSLGYSQSVRYLNMECSLDDAVAECQVKTRNYAKRQLTWFRAIPDIKWINEFGSSDKAKHMALDIASTFLVEFKTQTEKISLPPNPSRTLTSEKA